ncbi:DUF2285 domain-containing protein [Xanthobacter sp. AM11]|uniref:DUF2285 domain-containing protein n=1 Tax=Xanthobacter sp. AM11 TaxID=3380643 RepID=UPI0039BF2ED1
MVWLTQEDTSAIVLAEAPAVFSASAEDYPTIETAFSTDVEGGAFLLYDLGNGQRVQVVRPGVAPAGATLGAFVPLGIEGFDRLESIRRLLSSLHARAIPPDTRLTPQQRARLRRMLQSFDGYRDGATQQEIAQVVLRAGAFDRDDWQASSARHAIKSLLRDAHAMIAGGYRMLLRHRRPS